MQVPERRNPIERFLGLFTEVRPGESPMALLLTLSIFLLLTAYYIIKPVREALILSEGGAEIKSYSAAGQALLLLGVVPLYAALASRLDRRHLINYISWFFIGCLVLFYLLAQFQVPLGVVFFLWVGIFNVVMIAQFWSFANDLYTPEEGERLFVVVAFGGSSGAVFGSFLSGRLFGILGTYELLLVGAIILFASVAVMNLVDRREGGGSNLAASSQIPVKEQTLGKSGGFSIVFNKKYLLGIALLILLLNWVNTTGEYLLGRTVTQAAQQAVAEQSAAGLSQDEFIGRFYSDFFAVVNLLGLLLQLFVVSRIFKYLGVSAAILFLPAIAFAGYTLLALYPVLEVVRWAKTAENSTVVVYLGTSWLFWKTEQFAMFNLVLVAAWLILAVLIGREYRRMTRTDS